MTTLITSHSGNPNQRSLHNYAQNTLPIQIHRLITRLPDSLQPLELLWVGLVGPLCELIGALPPAGDLAPQSGGLALQDISTTLQVTVLLLAAENDG